MCKGSKFDWTPGLKAEDGKEKREKKEMEKWTTFYVPDTVMCGNNLILILIAALWDKQTRKLYWKGSVKTNYGSPIIKGQDK